MSSDAQMLANRRNAQRSTGPTTEEGKQAVSQNAVRHGLSARRDVIRGEDIEEFEMHREGMLRDLAPIGAMEVMLAQRIVGLSWRLVRAQRIQDAAIEALCAEYVDGPCKWDILRRVAKTVGRDKADRPGPEDELTLGLALVRDFSQERALERLQAYEGRIEASLYKAMAELEKLRRMRESQAQDQSSAAGPLPFGAQEPSVQNKANSPDGPARSVPVRAYLESPHGEGMKITPYGVTTNVQNEANLPAEETVSTAHPADAKQSQSAPVDPIVQNKANSPAQASASPNEASAGEPLPLGT